MRRVVLPISEPPLELLALNIFRNVHVDFLREPVYNAIRSNRLLKLYGESYPGTWQGHCFFFCIIHADIAAVFKCDCFLDKIPHVSFVHTGNCVYIHPRPIDLALGCYLNRHQQGLLCRSNIHDGHHTVGAAKRGHVFVHVFCGNDHHRVLDGLVDVLQRRITQSVVKSASVW